jgi:5-methylcytosine-specific restriction protein B
MFSWTTFYTEFADKLLPYKNNRDELLKHIYDTYETLGLKNPLMDNGSPMDDICPFTVFGCFNKGITDENRISIMKTIGSKLGVVSNISTQFEGIPVLNKWRKIAFTLFQ